MTYSKRWAARPFSLHPSTCGLSPQESPAESRASLAHPAGFDNVSAFLSQNNNKLYFFLHALIVFNEQASKALLDWRLFLVNPCNKGLKSLATQLDILILFQHAASSQYLFVLAWFNAKPCATWCARLYLDTQVDQLEVVNLKCEPLAKS